LTFFQPIKSLHFEANWPPSDVSSDKNSDVNWYFFYVQLLYVHTISEDGAAYGVHAALTQSFNMCLSMEDFQFKHILGFPWGSSGHAPKKCHMKKANLFARSNRDHQSDFFLW
jgi:hypothetical protein